MVRRFLLLVPASVLLALPALPLHSEQPVCDEETCELPPPSPHEHEEPRAEEEDDIGLELALEVEYALWLHLLRVMEREGGVLVLPELRGRDLVPIWTQLPVQTASGTFEVAVEMTAVSMLPSDFQSASEAGYPPALVPRAPEITNLARAARRGPDS
ncbi:MAG: hypothetical protein ACOCVR_03920, partial [Myxococcota bacterium]